METQPKFILSEYDAFWQNRNNEMNKIPHVTKLLDLLNKPALLKWANKIGLQGIELDKYRKDAMQKGTSLHKQIEKYLIDKTPFENSEDQIRFDEFMKDKEVLFSEKYIETEWFVGRLDIVLKYNNKTYLCDFKSQTGVYFENILQLVAYRIALNTDYVGIISIPEFTMIPLYHISDFTPYEEIIKHLSSIYKIKQKLDIK